MNDIIESIIQYLAVEQSLPGAAILFFTSIIEYVFPPFPGDTITLFGAFLAATGGWSVPLVFSVVTAGSTLGAAIDYKIGVRLARKPESELTGRALKSRERLRPILAQFQRWGRLLVILNRFMPGVRPLIFVAAGMSQMNFRLVLLLGALSASLWNALLMGAGFAVGKNWQRLVAILSTYTTVTWIIVIVVGVFLLARLLIQKRSNSVKKKD